MALGVVVYVCARVLQKFTPLPLGWVLLSAAFHAFSPPKNTFSHTMWPRAQHALYVNKKFYFYCSQVLKMCSKKDDAVFAIKKAMRSVQPLKLIFV